MCLGQDRLATWWQLVCSPPQFRVPGRCASPRRVEAPENSGVSRSSHSRRRDIPGNRTCATVPSKDRRLLEYGWDPHRYAFVSENSLSFFSSKKTTLRGQPPLCSHGCVGKAVTPRRLGVLPRMIPRKSFKPRNALYTLPSEAQLVRKQA